MSDIGKGTISNETRLLGGQFMIAFVPHTLNCLQFNVAGLL